MTADRIAELVADLCSRYGWQITAGDALEIRSAVRGLQPQEVFGAARLAARHARNVGRPFTPDDLTAALQARQQQRQPPRPAPIPPDGRIAAEHQAARKVGIPQARAALADALKPKE